MLEFDASKCVGCVICEIMCSLKQGNSVNPQQSLIRIKSSGDQGFTIRLCSGCGLCVEACPEEALQLNEATLTIQLDADKCSGCQLCVDTCGDGIVLWDCASGQPVFCDYCGRCTELCPTNALQLPVIAGM